MSFIQQWLARRVLERHDVCSKHFSARVWRELGRGYWCCDLCIQDDALARNEADREREVRKNKLINAAIKTLKGTKL